MDFWPGFLGKQSILTKINVENTIAHIPETYVCEQQKKCNKIKNCICYDASDGQTHGATKYCIGAQIHVRSRILMTSALGLGYR